MRRTTTTARLLLLLPGGLILLSLLAACLVLLRISFNAWDVQSGMVPDWQLANYQALLSDPTVRRAFVTTLRISLVVTLVCLVLGYPVAYAMANSPYRGLLIFLIVTPLMVDVLIRAYGWIVMLGRGGLVNVLMTSTGLWSEPKRLLYTELSVVLEMIHEFVPFMVLPIANVLERIDPSLREASMNLRAGPVRTFLHVVFPLSMPGILAGTLLTFALCMSAFVAPLVLGGGRVLTVTILMQQNMYTTLNWPMGAAQSILLVAIVIVLLALYRRQLR